MNSDSSSSSSSHLTSLSRAYRSREWSVPSVQRKRKRTRPRGGEQGPSVPVAAAGEDQWFEIRSTPSKGGGIGTFATQDIPSGHVLVPNERPIVYIPTLTNPNDSSSCCQACLTPLGDLRYQLGARETSSQEDKDHLPCCGPASSALQFTSPAKDLITCDLECGAQWCSAACHELEAGGKDRIEHSLLCCGPIRADCHNDDDNGDDANDDHGETNNNWKQFEPQRRFRDDVLYNPDGAQPMLILAGKVLTTILGALVRDLNKSSNMRPSTSSSFSTTSTSSFSTNSRTITELDDGDLFWWKEFAHPLWWEIGTATSASQNHNMNTTPQCGDDHRKQQLQQGRRTLCETSHALLAEALRSSISRTAKGVDWSRKKEDLLLSVMERLCTVQHLGEILGMLQCNVMEIEFPSPRQQFMSYLDRVIEDNSNRNNSHGNETQALEYKRWREQYISKRRAELGLPTASNNDDGDDDFDILEDIHSPITGSGLFPILTLANHDCDPNVSIEFLGESNRGSLVALRDISHGEEICITYILNGDFNCGDPNGARFRNVKPTRTWLYLNHCDQQHLDGASGTGETGEDEQYRGGKEGCCKEEGLASQHGGEAGSDEHRHVDDIDGREASNEEDIANTIDTEDLPDGTLWNARARSLLEYGFICRCARCLHEQRKENHPYCR